MTSPSERLQRDYRPAFLRYLARRDESARHAGYLLGREAVAQGQSLLELVAAHHVTLLEVLPDARDRGEVLSMSSAASEFLTEVLASFSMASAATPALSERLAAAQRRITELEGRADASSRGAGSP